MPTYPIFNRVLATPIEVVYVEFINPSFKIATCRVRTDGMPPEKQTNGKTNKWSEKLHSHIRKCGNNLSCELEKKRSHDPGSILLFLSFE